MAQESVRPINPAPDEFAGDSSARSIKRFFHATRPKFFPASVLPVVTGTAFGAFIAGSFDAYVFTLALVATVCVHAASNVLNDVGDETVGTDQINDQRIYPYTGGSRFIQMGILSQSHMAKLGVGLLAFSALLGLLLYLEKGPVVLLFGLAGYRTRAVLTTCQRMGLRYSFDQRSPRYRSRRSDGQKHFASAPGVAGNFTTLFRPAILSGHRHHLHDAATNAAHAGPSCATWLAGTCLAGCDCHTGRRLGQKFYDASHRINIGYSHNRLHLACRLHGI